MVEREPVYVTGSVLQPGVFKHTPGMTVLHVLALSGGVGVAGGDQWRRLDLTRERERLLKSEERLKQLLARASVLLAEQTGASASASKRLLELAGATRAEDLLAEAKRLGALELKRNEGEVEAHAAVISTLEHELTILRESTRDAETVIEEKAKRAVNMDTLRARGATTDMNFHLARTELSVARAAWNEIRAALARVERNLAQARQELLRATIGAQLERERELKQTREAIIDEETTRSVVAQLLVGPAGLTLGVDRQEEAPHVEIIRRTVQGPERLTGDEMTGLQPGDIVKVIRARSVSTADARW
jgi:hypothetical protein